MEGKRRVKKYSCRLKVGKDIRVGKYNEEQRGSYTGRTKRQDGGG